MKALRSFTVRPRLPVTLAPLADLAVNLRWSWDERTQSLFEWIDAARWDELGHDPMRLLAAVSHDRLAELAADSGFVGLLDHVSNELVRYVDEPRWFQSRDDSPLRSVAYFSPEFGISEALPQYSGGLGVLAGDHLKAASDLGIPLVGIGLFYRHGYFRQSLDIDGWQQERFPRLDPYALSLTPCDGVRIEVELAGIRLAAQIWRAQVGRIPLYLLDADVDENPDDLRTVTDRLYGGDVEHRLRQEILLGIGGVRALRALGIDTQVFHTNEGHAGFLGLERMRELITGAGMSTAEAIEAVRAGCLFTTHTPVPAGIDRFPRELMEKYFSGWATECGISIDDLLALGHRPGDHADERFNMAVMGLRLAGRSNGVSKLHGEVSRTMFGDLWPDVTTDEVPIGSITNGVHGQTWIAPSIDELLTRSLGEHWHERPDWSPVDELTPHEVWEVKRRNRAELVDFVRQRLRATGLRQGLTYSDVEWCDTAFDAEALTIGFARRFATYKRANLLLSQPERLRRLLLDGDRPVQFLFAGKAHPADNSGKELIRQIVKFSHDLGIRHRFAFIDDYEMAVARALYHGVDVWLNNPRRPLEACGTSGEKAALNGALNLSILDGWWDELFDGENGWAVSTADVEDDARRDELEANSLFGLLEQQVVPLYYDRGPDGVANGWVSRVKHAWRSLGPEITAARMVRDYVTELYEPLATRADALGDEDHARARALAAWKERVAAEWHMVHVDGVDEGPPVTDLGDQRSVTATVSLGRLSPDDVAVQVVHGPVGQSGELEATTVTTLGTVEALPDGHARFAGAFVCPAVGRYGFTVRVVPHHDDLTTVIDLGRVAWM